MTRVAHSGWNATVPRPTDPVCDEFAVRFSSGPALDSTLDRDLGAQWVGRLRRISETKLRPWGLGPLVDDAKLLVSELVTNALRYGEGGEIEFRLVVTRQGTTITVNDGSTHRPHLKLVGASSETGRGLVLVAAIAGDWGVSADGTTTWCTLTLAGADR